MRSTTSWVVTVLLVMAGGNVFWWQHSQIASYRAQLEDRDRQDLLSEHPYRRTGYSRDLALAASASTSHSASSGGLTRADLKQTDFRADDRGLILDQYRDAISRLNLPPEKASQLLDLLDERVQAVLDAEDNARRQGYAEASAVTQRAIAMAIAQEDQRIVQLIGLVGQRMLDGLGATASGASAPPAGPTTMIVNVMPAPLPDFTAPAYTPLPDYDAGGYGYPYIYTSPYIYTTGIGSANYGGGARAYSARGGASPRGAGHATFASHSSGRRR